MYNIITIIFLLIIKFYENVKNSLQIIICCFLELVLDIVELYLDAERDSAK